MKENTMRRSDRALSLEDAKRIIHSSSYGVLSLSHGGIPYGVPLSPAYDESNQKLYFHCALEGFKINLIKKNSNAHFLFVSRAINLPERASVDYSSTMVTGSCYIVEDEAERMHAFELITQRYMAGYDDQIQKHMQGSSSATIVGFDIKSISGKQNS